MPRRRRDFGFDAASHERHHWWRSLLFKLVICGGVTAVLYRVSGWMALLVSLMLWGRLFAGDLVALFETLGRWLRGRSFQPVQGRFYAFRGQRMRVLDDELEACRWIAVEDLALALEESIRLPGLQSRFASALREEKDGWYLRDQEALDYLWQRQADRAGPLRQWVEREVWYPARGRAASYQRTEAKGAREGAPKA